MIYVGIDLGTTNSAICSYDGENISIHKSPDQHDVTPSAIFVDKRGNKYFGSRAYNQAARNPDAAAILFKRMMGTNTPVNLPAVNRTMTPEECSAEILRLLFGYLPEETRRGDNTGTVITVPAAFNQMQKDATMSSAEMAGVGQVALMQEPVAAVMSVMRQRKSDGIFLVYDLGGGTLDIALAESISGSVSLLAHGGIEMCGGRDFDLLILRNVIVPWLQENFDLPDLLTNLKYKPLLRMAVWAGEKAKIELSQRQEAIVSLPDIELGVRDQTGEEVYLDVAISRSQYDDLIAHRLDESVQVAHEIMKKAGLSSNDVERIIFIGGPTPYKPLRDKVASALGISPSTEVNPMTAVAEGASLFAESIDWSTRTRGRKSSRGSISSGGMLKIAFDYTARTPKMKAKIVAKLDGRYTSGVEFQIDSLDTGWSSGRLPLKDGTALALNLSKPGENIFKIFVFDENGSPIVLDKDQIVISRTAASVDAIPVSQSIGVEVREKVGGRLVLDFLIREGEQLPKKGKKIFKAEESLRAGRACSLKFKLWEGEIEDPIEHNRFIGMFEIKGSDFDDGVISAGADLICEYEILDSGNIVLEVAVPSISSSFHSGRNFYSRQPGGIDYTQASKLVMEQSENAIQRLDEIGSKIQDPMVDRAREKLEQTRRIKAGESDPETVKQAMDKIQEAKRLLAQARKEHLKEIRQLDLDKTVEFFNNYVRRHSRSSEESTFDNLVKTAQRSIDHNSGDFETQLSELRGKNFMILWRQDYFVVDRFKWLAEDSYLFPDAEEHQQLVKLGTQALKVDNIDELRHIVYRLDSIRFLSGGEDKMLASSNILQSSRQS